MPKKYPQQVYKNSDGQYVHVVSKAQVAKINEFNNRSKLPYTQIGGNCEVVEIVEDSDLSADMITGLWFGMVVGILPDGSAHS